MRKNLFFVLTLFILSAASMNAQVTIGSTEDPHPGAILDLQSTTQGLHLSQVELSNVATDFRLAGDKAAAGGMLVYNTANTLKGPGLYVWTGGMWQSFTANCILPAKPSAITFTPTVANKTFSQDTIFTAAVPITLGATSYEWTLPAGLEIEGEATGRSVKIRVKEVNSYDATGITVKAKNDCGSSDPVAGSGTFNVVIPTKAPGVPVISGNTTASTLDIGDTYKLKCTDVGATSYT
jgi:hypothetical protein